MLIGTTPTHTFGLPFETNVISKIKVTYAQNGRVILEKGNEECEFNENTVTLKLSQEDTFLFECGKNVEIQVRILTAGGDALASNIRIISADKCLDSEVLV